MAAGNDEREAGRIGQRPRGEFFPDIGLDGNFLGKIMMIGERGAVVENGDVEIQLRGERRDGLCDVARAGDP